MAATAAANGSTVAAVASMCSVGLLLEVKGELRAGEEGSGPDLAGDDAGAAQRVEVLPWTDQRRRTAAAQRRKIQRRRRMNPNKTKIFIFF